LTAPNVSEKPVVGSTCQKHPCFTKKTNALPPAAAFLAAYIEDVKASGLVAQLIEKHKAHGLTVAEKA